MTQVRPFRGFSYNPEIVPDLSSVVAPPYDVVTDDERAALAGRSPFNFIHMTLPAHYDPNSDSRQFYGEASNLWDDWRENGIVSQSAVPEVLRLKETYDSSEGRSVTRFGFLAQLALTEESNRFVLKHERTHTAPRMDRVRLYQNTRANLSPLFFVYKDDPDETSEILRHFEGLENREAVLSHRGEVSLELASTSDATVINKLCASFEGKHVLIADGHHRYEASRILHSENSDHSIDSSSVLAYLVPASSEGLIVHATHRGLHGVDRFDEVDFITALESRFELSETSFKSPKQFEIATETRGRFFVALDASTSESLTNRLETEAMANLPVVILEEIILKDIFGMSDKDISAKTNLHYFQDQFEQQLHE